MRKAKGINRMNPWTSEIFKGSGQKTPKFRRFSHDLKQTVGELLPGGWKIARWTTGHFFCSAFLMNDQGQYAYISVSDVRYFPKEWYNCVLVRAAKGLEDFTGGMNTMTPLENLERTIQEVTEKEVESCGT